MSQYAMFAAAHNTYLVFVPSIMLLTHLGLQQQHRCITPEFSDARRSDVQHPAAVSTRLTESCVRYVSQ